MNLLRNCGFMSCVATEDGIQEFAIDSSQTHLNSFKYEKHIASSGSR